MYAYGPGRLVASQLPIQTKDAEIWIIFLWNARCWKDAECSRVLVRRPPLRHQPTTKKSKLYLQRVFGRKQHVRMVDAGYWILDAPKVEVTWYCATVSFRMCMYDQHALILSWFVTFDSFPLYPSPPSTPAGCTRACHPIPSEPSERPSPPMPQLLLHNTSAAATIYVYACVCTSISSLYPSKFLGLRDPPIGVHQCTEFFGAISPTPSEYLEYMKRQGY